MNTDPAIYSMIKRAVKYGNLKEKIFCFILERLGYSNKELQDLEVRNKVYCYCKRKYTKFLDRLEYLEKDSGVDSNHVWVCWLQGLENAPDIVKICVESMYTWLPQKEIHFLDENNIYEYIDLPDYIIQKWKQGIITNTLFSDFIRLSVLTRYGGMWLDATVFLTGELPKYIERSNFFVYKSNSYDISKYGESWFIKARSNNRILLSTLALLNEYWRNENKIRDYFIMFIFMRMACEKYKHDVRDSFSISSMLPHMMQSYLNQTFDQDMFDDICNITPIHKLTYKVDTINQGNSFFERIKEGNAIYGN